MYATTRSFLDYFNLKTLDQLPALAELRDLETLNAELGFADPVADQAAPAGLTLVGGTAHQPDTAGAEAAGPAAQQESAEIPVAEPLEAAATATDAAEPDAEAEDADSDESQSAAAPESRN
jgi:segregation and condensation protein B